MPQHDYKNVITPVQQQGPGPGQSQDIYDPRRAPSVQSDVAVPLLQAVVSAIVVGLLIAGILWLLDMRGDVIGQAFVIVACSVLVIMWFYRLGWVEKTIERVETLSGVDLNGDGYVPPHAYTVNAKAGKFDPIAFEKARLQEFIAYAYAHGTDTPTLRSQFNDKEIARFRVLLMQPNVGCAMWKAGHHNQGWQFTEPLEKTLEIVSGLQWER